MTMMPNTSSKLEGLQKECCDKYLEYHHDGDGVEWEIWKCPKCKLQYVIPIEISRDYDHATIVDNDVYKAYYGDHNADK